MKTPIVPSFKNNRKSKKERRIDGSSTGARARRVSGGRKMDPQGEMILDQYLIIRGSMEACIKCKQKIRHHK